MSIPDIDQLRRRADVGLLRNKTVAILGYGTQGSAHALNLRDSGVGVIVAQRPGNQRYNDAIAAGFEPVSIVDACRAADLLIMGLPDEAMPGIYHEILAPHLRRGQTLGFLHGYVIHYREIEPPADVDVILVAPKAQGRGVRSTYQAGFGPPAVLGVQQDATGHAWDTALGWAAGIGAHRSALFTATFAQETETDLFGEQAVLCGGLSALIKAGFETLVEAGYPPELAYIECCHELKLIVDLVHEGGLTYMRERISNTARFGDLTRGPRVIDERTRATMRDILNEVRSGQFAREWADETQRGRPHFVELTEADRNGPLDTTGQRVRDRMRHSSED